VITIAKKAVVLSIFYGFSDDELPEMAKLLPVACEQLKNEIFKSSHTWPVLY